MLNLLLFTMQTKLLKHVEKMPKHRWRESLRSFVGSHVDREKDEEFKGSKAGISVILIKLLKCTAKDLLLPFGYIIFSSIYFLASLFNILNCSRNGGQRAEDFRGSERRIW